MPSDTRIAALVSGMPSLDVVVDKSGQKRQVGKLTGPPWPEAQEVFDAILAAGRDGVLAVVDMLSEVDDGGDYKARYVLHGLAVSACRQDRKQHRAAMVEALASQIGSRRPRPVQAFLIRQLQVVGDRQAVPALGKALTDEELCAPAVAALLAIRDGAAEQLRSALPNAKGPARAEMVQALGVLKDAPSIPSLRAAAADADRETRIAAVWALANIGDPGAVDVLVKASDADGWERIQATKACLVLAENLLAAGRKAEAARICVHLRDTRRDKSEAYVRNAVVALMCSAG